MRTLYSKSDSPSEGHQGEKGEGLAQCKEWCDSHYDRPCNCEEGKPDDRYPKYYATADMDLKLRKKLLDVLENPEKYPEEYELLMEVVDEATGYRRDDPYHPGRRSRWPRKDDPLHPGPPGPGYFEKEGQTKRTAKEDDGVWDLPPGWTEQSAKDFWKGMGGSVTKCVEKLEDEEDIKDAGAFCSSLADKIEGKAWRHEPREKKSSTEDLLHFVYDTGRLLTAGLSDEDFDSFSGALCVAMEELEERGAGTFGEQALEEAGLL